MTFSSSSFSLAVRLFSVFGLSTFAFATPSYAASFSNGSFENNLDDWMTAGDVSVQGTFDGSSPTDGSSQVLLTTGSTVTQDEQPLPVGTYNFSGNDIVSTQFPGFDLQAFLGIDPDALDVASNFPGLNLSPNEGSAIKQSFSSDTDFSVSFDWNFLTNDGDVPGLSSTRDYAFVILTKDGEAPIVQTLDSSSGDFPSSLNGINFNQQSGLNAFDSGLLSAGDYHLAFGVVDISGTDKTSALLVDNVFVDRVQSPQPVPEPGTLLGLSAVVGLAGFSKKLQRKS